MKKVISLMIVSICVSLVGMAQNGVTRFSVGPELGIATGTFGLGWGLGIGASAQAEHFFQENLSGTALVGFVSYLGKSIGNGLKYKAINIIPLRVGARFYPVEGFHLGAQIGLGFLTGGGSSSTAFSYSPQVGYNFKTNSGKPIDATFKYDGYTKDGTLGALGIRVALVL